MSAVTCRARRPFLYQGRSIMPGDSVTLPVAEYERLRLKSQGRCVEHILDPNIRGRMYAPFRRRRSLEFFFE